MGLTDFDDGLDRAIRGVLAGAGVPGAAVAIALPGQSVVQGYGAIAVKSNEPVTPDTAFDVGSCSKAYVATAIALLAGKGKLGFDDPVRKYLPGFELDEEWITETITIRDLLCNRTGLRRQIPVTAYCNPEITAQDILRRVRFMDRAHAFREGYVYFNPGFMACAQVVEQISGMPYSVFLENELLSAIGMNHTASGPRVADVLSGRAIGHTFIDGQPVPVQGPAYYNLEGAAAVYTSANDAVRWMNFHLDGGRIDHSQLIDAEILAQIHTPHNRIPDPECKLIHRPPGAERCDYCMGWWATQFNGQPLLQHAGESVGWRTMVALLPQQKIGVSVFLGAAAGVHHAIAYTILEKLLTGHSRDWAALAAADHKSTALQIESQAEATFPCTPGAAASVELEKLAGRYWHDACGEVRVSVAGNGLRMKFIDGRLWDMRLTHIGNDVFECRLTRPEARDFTSVAWRARFEIQDGKVVWLEDLNARYRLITQA